MRKHVPFGLILIVVTLLSSLLFYSIYRWDNKYTYPAHPANMGVTRLDAAQYAQRPLLFLVDDWAYYDDKLLTPVEIPAHFPDEYLYIGRYSGFHRGDPEQSPYGQATYRMTVLTDDTYREYALELPELFSEGSLWINGELRQVVSPGTRRPQMFTFFAQGQIEIVISVADTQSLYSGFTYPPAFGSPESVNAMLTKRLIFHLAATLLAIFIAALCLLLSVGNRLPVSDPLLALLCLFVAGCVAYPILQAVGLTNVWTSAVERFCYYGVLLLLMLLQSKVCRLPARFWRPLAALGGLICLSTLLLPFFTIERAGDKYLYSAVLAGYKWLTAGWLILTGLWAIHQDRPYSKPLLAGAFVFATALVFDRWYPLFEPVISGWFVELAGFILMFIGAGIFAADTRQIYKKKIALEVEKRSLEEMSRLKSEFLSQISHELQMPLTVVSGYAQLADRQLKSRALDVKKLRQHQQQIIGEADRMERMVQQLLDISRIESGQFTVEKKVVVLDDVLQRLQTDYFPVLNERHNRLSIRAEAALTLYCDEEKILQVLVNLLANACRHTSGGEITISAQSVAGAVQISVADTGAGIAPEHQRGLFEQYMGHGRGQAKPAGTGLGLYICKKIITAHAGNIQLESRVGAGTTVRFEIPAQKNPGGEQFA